MKKQFRNFKDAKKFAQTLNLKSIKEWMEYAKSGKRPDDIPSNVNTIYKNKGWISWGEFLGTGIISTQRREYLKFNEARKFVRSLKLKNRNEWEEYRKSGKKPENIPAMPNQVYKNKGWINMGDFLGTGSIAPKDRKYISFEDAKKLVQKIGLKSSTEWRKYCNSKNKPNTIPTHPHIIYKNKGWKDWGDWFGTKTIATQQRKYLSFDKARKIIQSKNLKSSREWKKYTKDVKFPKNIPMAPALYYKNKGWTSMGDFLGTGTIQPQLIKYRAFEDAREFVHSLGLKSTQDWRKYCDSGKKPEDIPQSPYTVWKNKGWKGMGDWVGTGRLSPQERSKNFLSYSEARKVVHELAKKHNIRTNNDWNDAVKKGLIPDNIPASPRTIYTKGKKK